MQFFDWTDIIPPISREINVLIDEYFLIAKTQKFYKDNTPIIELYADCSKLFPKEWHNYVSLVCEQDVFLLDQICHALWPSKSFSVVRYEDPTNKYWYHYTLEDEDMTIYDLQLHYIPERKEWLKKMVPKQRYVTKAEKLQLMDSHGFPWAGEHRTLYL